MISLRPHIILYRQASAGSTDENGIWQEGSNSFEGNIPCRAKSNGRARAIVLPDGQSYVYSYIVYLDADVRDFPIGEFIRVQDEVGNIIINEKQVQGFNRGQLNSKLYL